MTGLIVTLALTTAVRASAQVIALDSVNVADSSRRHLIRLAGGSNLLGRIIRVTDSVHVERADGSVTITRQEVREVLEFDASRLRQGTWWPEHQRATRLLLASTAFVAPEGSLTYATAFFMFHSIEAGLTDRVQLTAGFSLLPGIEIGENIVWLQPQVQVLRLTRVHVAVGTFFAAPFSNPENVERYEPRWAGLLYGVASVGDRDSNLSLGLGWGYDDRRVSSHPVGMAGGHLRLTRHVGFISENWFSPGDLLHARYGRDLSFMNGVRLLTDRWSFDIAALHRTRVRGAGLWLGLSFRSRSGRPDH